MEMQIILNKKEDLKDYILIEGFPGIGLVGTIAAGYIIEKRKMKPIGHIYSDAFPPMTTIHEGRPYYPARIYKDPEKHFCVIIAEFIVPAETVYPLSTKIMEFAKENGIRQIVSLAGMTSEKEEMKEVFAIVSNDEMEKYLTKKKIKIIKEGVTTGVSGVLIAKSAAENFPAMSLLVESKYGYPDPRAASTLIEKLDNIIGLKIDTKDLMKEAGQIEDKMRGMISQIKKSKRGYKISEEDLPMYS